MKNTILIAVLAACCALTVCQANAQSDASIPLQLQQGRPLVNVTVNHVPLTVLLDFGGGGTIVLNKADAEKTGAFANNATQSVSTFDGAVHNVSAVHLNMVTAGDAIFGEIDGSVVGADGDSYMGAGLLDKKLVVFDYAHNQVRLYKSGDAHAMQRECGTDNFPVDVRHGLFQTYVRVDGKTLTAAFDTGSNISVIRPSVLNLKVAAYVPGSSPEIHQLHKLRFNLAEMAELSAVLIEFKGPPVDIILGTNFFLQRRVCLDGPAHMGAMH
jgi:predicted aspartyl protease